MGALQGRSAARPTGDAARSWSGRSRWSAGRAARIIGRPPVLGWVMGGPTGRRIAGFEGARRPADSAMHAAARARCLRVRGDVGPHPYGFGRCRRHVRAAAQWWRGVRGAVAGARRAAHRLAADAVAARDHRRRPVAEDRRARAPARDRSRPRPGRRGADAGQPAGGADRSGPAEDELQRDRPAARGAEAADRPLPRAPARDRPARAHAAPQRRAPGAGADRRAPPAAGAHGADARRPAARARAARSRARALTRRRGRLPGRGRV